MTPSSTGLLLDTCALIWLANGDPLASEALKAIGTAAVTESLFVSPVSAWEIGILSQPRANRRPAATFLPDPKTWFSKLLNNRGMRLAALTPEIAIDAYHLPGPFHGDPADRLIVSTALHLGVPVLTRDTNTLAFAQAGHIAATAC